MQPWVQLNFDLNSSHRTTSHRGSPSLLPGPIRDGGWDVVDAPVLLAKAEWKPDLERGGVFPTEPEILGENAWR